LRNGVQGAQPAPVSSSGRSVHPSGRRRKALRRAMRR
jgi:hypothetical protein